MLKKERRQMSVVLEHEPAKILKEVTNDMNKFFEQYAVMPTEIVMSTRMNIALNKMFVSLNMYSPLVKNTTLTFLGMAITIDDDCMVQSGTDFVLVGEVEV